MRAGRGGHQGQCLSSTVLGPAAARSRLLGVLGRRQRHSRVILVTQIVLPRDGQLPPLVGAALEVGLGREGHWLKIFFCDRCEAHNERVVRGWPLRMPWISGCAWLRLGALRAARLLGKWVRLPTDYFN